MCKIGIMLGTAGENLSSAILFMNSNKSEKNIVNCNNKIKIP